MRKIPTVFRRDPTDMQRVLPEVNPGCEWVLAGEGTALRKYDGTCVMFDGDRWWARREVKKGKPAPEGYVLVQSDEVTGKAVGWEPAEQSPFTKFLEEALEPSHQLYDPMEPGTYELVGPKINANPEREPIHVLFRHDHAEVLGFNNGSPRRYDLLRGDLRMLARMGIEGIVYHHPDGRMAKLKGRDFPEGD